MSSQSIPRFVGFEGAVVSHNDPAFPDLVTCGHKHGGLWYNPHYPKQLTFPVSSYLLSPLGIGTPPFSRPNASWNL
jgi:hypothetical protein